MLAGLEASQVIREDAKGKWQSMGGKALVLKKKWLDETDKLSDESLRPVKNTPRSRPVLLICYLAIGRQFDPRVDLPCSLKVIFKYKRLFSQQAGRKVDYPRQVK